MNMKLYKREDENFREGACIALNEDLYIEKWMLFGFFKGVRLGYDEDVEAIIITYIDGHPIASAVVLNLEDCQFQIFVKEEYRRQGIGSKMFDYGMKEMNRKEPFKMWVDHSEIAEKFYEKNCKSSSYSINQDNDNSEEINAFLEKIMSI